jgi:hypothetical protein
MQADFAAQDDAQLTLEASDARGEPADVERLPRRPSLRLTHPDGLAPIEDAIVWLAGAPDHELIDDLSRAPLSAMQRARRVDCALELSGDEARITPRAALEPGASYTLAVAAWARTLHDARVTPEGEPVVFELHTDAELGAGARPLAAWPADGASGVGTNLEAAVVAFDGAVQHADAGVWLEGPDGLAVPAALEAGACAEIAPLHPGAFCVRLMPESRLAPAAVHHIAIGSAARDGRGAPIGPWQATFRTAASRDEQSPAPIAQGCSVDEQALDAGCALVDDHAIALRLQTDEPVTAELLNGAASVGVAAADGRIALQLSGLDADTPLALRLVLRDYAGNSTEQAIALRTAPTLPALSIVEVLADPLGPEPQQEFVELLNYGNSTVALDGFTLADSPDAAGTPLTTPAQVAPQARALLVADGFDPHEGRDVAPLPGALLVRVGRALGNAGLRNAGEPLFLRDVLGRRVSAAPATPRPEPGVCSVRVGEDMRSGAATAFAYDAGGTCTPGF